MKRTTIAVLLGLACIGFARPSLAATPRCSASNGVQTCSIDPTLDRNALCNDGTVPAFWYRPGSGNGVTRWLVWLQGGSECFDAVSCTLRASIPQAKILVTASGFTADAGTGLMSASSRTNPSLYNVNTVFVHYCSSDTWSGDRAATGRIFVPALASTWQFRGRRIAMAAVQSIRELVPAFSAATQVILGGDSAGGVGITLTANDLLPLLPSGVPVLLINDAGFALNIGQFDSSAPAPYVFAGHPNAFETQIAARLAFWHARGDKLCDAAATTSAQHANCYDTSYVLKNGYIQVPTFVAESLIDTAQVRLELCPNLYGKCIEPSNPGTQAGQYATAFGAHMAANLQAADTAATYANFSPDQYVHVILSDNSAFTQPFQFTAGGLSARDALDAWLTHPAAAARATYIGNAPGVGVVADTGG